MAEVITPGENGFLVDSSEPEQLAEAILSIRRNPDKVRTVVENGCRLVGKKYAMENQIEKVEAILNECLGLEAEKG